MADCLSRTPSFELPGPGRPTHDNQETRARRADCAGSPAQRQRSDLEPGSAKVAVRDTGRAGAAGLSVGAGVKTSTPQFIDHAHNPTLPPVKTSDRAARSHRHQSVTSDLT